MPVGYLITTGLMAAIAWAAVLRHRPRHSRPFRPSYVLGLWLNWPSVVIAALAASTALAAAQSGVGPGFWIGLGLAALAVVALVLLHRRARGTGPAVERGLDEALGPDWRDRVDHRIAARLSRRPSLARVLLAPITFRRHGVERVANIRYGPGGRGNLLDVYRDRSDRTGRPTLIHLHGGAFRFGSKRFGARYLLHRLAADGWVCVSANYSLRSATDSDPLTDVKRVIAWVREHGPEHGADPGAVFIAGSSAGARLAVLGADTPVAAVITLYGYYGPTSEPPPSNPPPFLVVHGDQDSLVIVDDARRFVDRLRAASDNPTAYVELPGAQHGFDLFRSRRLETVVDAIEAFAASISSASPRTS